MAKKQLKININNAVKGKTYDLKNVSDIYIIYDSNLADDLKMSVSGSTMTMKVCGNTLIYKFTGISANMPIKVYKGDTTEQFNGTLQEFYTAFMAVEYTVSKNVVNGSLFSDIIDVHAKSYKGKGYSINSGKGNDTVTGTAFADVIKGDAGSDTITGFTGNDKLYGGAGNNKFIFSAGDGVDTVYSNGGTDTLQFNNFADADALKAGVTLVSNGTDLRIKYTDSDTVLINNYYKNKVNSVQKVAGADGNTIALAELINASSPIIVNGSGTITGTKNNDFVTGSAKADTVKALAGNDIINAGKGNDKIYAGAGQNTIVFNAGDGVDTVYSNGGTDTLKFNNFNSLDELKSGVTLISDGTNLKVKYSATDTVVINNYYKNKANSVKGLSDANGNTISLTNLMIDGTINISGKGTITGTNGNDKITGSTGADTIKALAGDDIINAGKGNDKIYGGKGNDTINAGAGKNNIYYSLGDGDDTIVYGGGTDTLVFAKGTIVSAVYSGKDLLVSYSGSKNGVSYNNTITIADYKTKSSVKNITIGTTTKAISKFIDNGGGGGGKTYVSTGEDEEWAYWTGMKKENHTFLYDLANADPEYKTFGYDLIGTPNTAGSGYTDTFQFNNHSIQRHDTKHSVTLQFLKHTLEFRIWNGTTDFAGMAQYIDVTDNNPKIVVKDADGITYNLKTYKGARTIDNHASTLNPITFIDAEKGTNSYIIGNNKYNYAGVYKGNLTYTYNGGHDRVDVAEDSDDTYIINSFTASSVMTVDEEGGNDTINFKNTSADDIRPLFNVMRHEDKYYRYYDRLTFAHKDSDIASNLKAAVAVGAVDVNGAIFIYDYNSAEGHNIDNIQTLGISDIDEDTWFDAITQRVGDWLTTYGYYDVNDALWGNNPASPEALEELYACYTDVVYSEVATDSQVIPHDPGTRGAYTGTDGNDQFVSTDGNDSFDLFKGNDIVTFGEKFGDDVITSESVAGRGNTDTLKFTNRSIYDYDLTFATQEDMGNPGQYNLVISTDDGENSVTYSDFFGANAPKVKIIDTEKTYYADGYSSAQNINHSNDSKNHIDFILADSGESTVSANDRYNMLNTDGGAALTYNYKGGHDKVVATSETSNDTYNINTPVKKASITIADLGGDDTVNITDSASLDDLRLFIDVRANGTYDPTNIAIFDKGAISAENLPNIYSGYDAPGVHIYAFGNDNGIETLTYNGEEINTGAWYDEVAQNVVSWLSNTAYGSAGEAIAAFAENPDNVDISGLVSAYANVNYDNLMA